MLNSQTIEFDYSELKDLALLLSGLNTYGVPYTLQKDNIGVAVTIGRGY